MTARFAVLLSLTLALVLCTFAVAAPAALAQTATPAATPAATPTATPPPTATPLSTATPAATPTATPTATPPPATPLAASAQPILPSQLTLAMVRGEIETRRLFLRLPSTSTVNAYLLDLPNGEGTDVLPASAMQIVTPGGVISGPVAVTLTVALAGPVTAGGSSWAAGCALAGPAAQRACLWVACRLAACCAAHRQPSGRYAGNMLFTFGASEQWLPITVSVKDRWPLPLAVLVLGVLLGYSVTFYRDRFLPRDQLVVEIDDLRARMAADGDLSNPAARLYRERAERERRYALQAAQAGDLKPARERLTAAQRVYALWSREPHNWLEVLEFQGTLLAEAKRKGLADRPGEHAQELLAALDGGALNAVIESALPATADTSVSTAQLLRDRLVKVDGQVNTYASLVQQIDTTRKSVSDAAGDKLDGQAKQGFIKRLDEQEAKLNALKPVSDPEDEHYAVPMREIEQAVSAIEEEVLAALGNQPAKPSPPQATAQGGQPWADLAAGEVTPSLARTRRLAYNAALSAVVLVVLVGTGFYELYTTNPTFGAGPWADYLRLFTWGFGAEALRGAYLGPITTEKLSLPGTRTGA